MTAVLRDAYGLPVSTASLAALDAYDRGLRALLGFGADAGACFAEALGHDPEFVLARAGLAVALYLDEKILEGRAEMDRAAAAAGSLPARERRHVEARALWVRGKGSDAIPAIMEILAEHPRDVMLIQRLYSIYFWQGRSADMLQLTRSVVDAFDGDSYILGMHAFSLEENRQFREALPLAERAVALNPKDAWAVHAIAHVLYERGENDRGVDALPPRIHPCDHLGYFRNHLLWHLALMHLAEGRYERAARLFERVFARIPVTIASDLQDSVSLAWRFDLFGHPDPRRWEHLGAAALRWLDMPLLLFHDLHVGMALAAAADWRNAELQLARMRERARKTRNRTLPEVVVPLLEGLHAFARGEHAVAVERIAPVEDRIWEVGGSHAQREVFHDTLLAAALRAGMPDRAAALLERRLARRPNPGRYWVETARVALGDGAGRT
jgi:tetratricopeptide (TPR) repeat protein